MDKKFNIIMGILTVICFAVSIIGLIITKSHWFLLPIPALVFINMIIVVYIIIKSSIKKGK